MPHYVRKIDRLYTGKFAVGLRAKIVDGGKWPNPYITICEVKSDKRSHHYWVQMSDGIKLWFSEDELEAT